MVIGCVSISAFPSLLGISIGNKGLAIGLTICVIIKKKKEKAWKTSIFREDNLSLNRRRNF